MKQELTLANVGLSYRVALRYRWRTDYDEILSVCLEALCRAAAGFDPERGVPFGGYASSCIRFAVAGYFRDESKRTECTGFNEAIDATIDEPPEPVDRTTARRLAAVCRAARELSPTAQAVFAGLRRGETLREISGGLNVSPQAVWQQKKKLFAALRQVAEVRCNNGTEGKG
jgi:RNA polymerase sigma factor (sigma-70 family)